VIRHSCNVKTSTRCSVGRVRNMEVTDPAFGFHGGDNDRLRIRNQRW
jgi:hypothetical protein